MPDKSLRQFERLQDTPCQPIKAAEEHKSMNSHKYMVKNTFVPALWVSARGHDFSQERMRDQAIPPTTVSVDYIWWYGLYIRGYKIPIDCPMVCIFPHVVDHYHPHSWICYVLILRMMATQMRLMLIGSKRCTRCGSSFMFGSFRFLLMYLLFIFHVLLWLISLSCLGHGVSDIYHNLI